MVYKMAASGGAEVVNDAKVGVNASFIEFYVWCKFGDPCSYGIQTRVITVMATMKYLAYPINALSTPLVGSDVK